MDKELFLEPEFVFFILVVAANLLLSFGVYHNDQRSATHKMFGMLGLSTSLWLVAMFLASSTADPQMYLWLARLTTFLATPMNVLFFLFARTLPAESLTMPNRYFRVLLLAAIVVMLFSLSPYEFSAVNTIDDRLKPVPGPFLPVFGIFSIALIVSAVLLLIKKARQSEGRSAQQYHMVIMGIGVMFALVVGTIFFPVLFFENSSFVHLAPLYTTLFLGATAYAIVRHQFMDIRVILQRGAIYTIIFSLVVSMYVAVMLLLGGIFRGAVSARQIIGTALTMVIGIYTVPIIDKYLRKITDSIFFKDAYDYSEAMRKLSKVLNKNLEVEKIISQTSDALKNIFKPDVVYVVVFHQAASRRATNGPCVETISYSERMVGALKKNGGVIDHSEIPFILHDPKTEQGQKELLSELVRLSEQCGIALSVPIILEDEAVGWLHLGKKLSGDLYTEKDVGLLETFSYQAAVAIKKAELHEKVENHSRDLEQQVAKRTEELKKLQEQQKQMMVDISHGLQTPLTVLRGELGFFNKRTRGSKRLKALEKSIEDISKLIYELLNLSRMESSPEIVKKEPVNVSALLAELVEYLTVVAQEKGIRITSDIAPKVTTLGNKKLLHEMVTNLVSNAFKYASPKRKRKYVRITLCHTATAVELCVADNGIGISRKELPKIFNRFYQVGNMENQKNKGTGLGLAITKTIVEKHGGTIAVTSTVGHGSCFTVRFPLL